jgi:2-oxoglutarate ferredoxin oxidoreductase subunit beta
VLSPCVTFNDHEGSTKSYQFTREHYEPVVEADFVPFQREISTDYGAGEAVPVMLHDGSRVVLRKLAEDYDPTDAHAAYDYVQQHIAKGEYLTGLLHCRPSIDTEFHALNRTPEQPLNQLPFEKLVPGAKALDKVLARYR